MGFFSWLFGNDGEVSRQKTKSFLKGSATIHQAPRVFENDLQRVPKWCRAGRNGKVIVCPHCGHEHTVYQFSWETLRCNNCEAMVDKYDWFLGADANEE